MDGHARRVQPEQHRLGLDAGHRQAHEGGEAPVGVRVPEHVDAARTGRLGDGVDVLGDPDPRGRLPHLVCLAVAGVEAEPVLLGLDAAGVAVHSGSACSSEALVPSPVLEAMGVDAERSLRVSVGWSTTDDDVAALCRALPEVVARLRALGAAGGPTRRLA